MKEVLVKANNKGERKSHQGNFLLLELRLIGIRSDELANCLSYYPMIRLDMY